MSKYKVGEDINTCIHGIFWDFPCSKCPRDPAEEDSHRQEILEAYNKGFEDGLSCFSWWKDAVQYVGTCGNTLKESLKKMTTLYGYMPPK